MCRSEVPFDLTQTLVTQQDPWLESLRLSLVISTNKILYWFTLKPIWDEEKEDEMEKLQNISLKNSLLD